MPQLKKPHKGWTNEHIAKSILSEFCFIAEPSTTGDDIGSDLFCTGFTIDCDQLYPKNSFAIQVKSNSDEIDITKNIEYFMNLEIPFFVGVVEKTDCPILKIYSGESICHFFTMYGNIADKKENTLKIKLTPERNSDTLFSHDATSHAFHIYFPLVLELKSGFQYENNGAIIDNFYDLCQLIQRNISRKLTYSYLFDLFKSRKRKIYAGPGSAKQFRRSFRDKFSEVVENINWLDKNEPESIKKGEIKAIRDTHNLLKDFYELPPINLPDTTEKI